MTILRLAMRYGPRGVTRIAAQFPAERVGDVARHAAAIAALSPGCEWSIQNERGGKVDVSVPVEPAIDYGATVSETITVIAEPVAPTASPPAPEPPKVSAIAGLWALIRGR